MQQAILLAIMALTLPGCIAKTALDVATTPVKAGAKAGGKAADWATTSQDEADRARGREMRKEEERAQKEEQRQRKACRDAGYRDC